MRILKKLHNKQVDNLVFIGLLVLFGAGIAIWYLRPTSAGARLVGEHPLSAADTVPLCSLLPMVAGGKNCQDAEPQITVAGHSLWKDGNGIPLLRADLISTRNLSAPEQVSTANWLENAIPEIAASGRQDLEEPSGPWSRAIVTRRDTDQEMLLEDKGIVLILQSTVMDRKQLLAYAKQAAEALRKAKPVISSEGDATPK